MIQNLPRSAYLHGLIWFSTIAIGATTMAAESGKPPMSQPLSPQETPGCIALPDGFRATLFAGEPDVVQPIGMTVDDRGRVWVVESFAYPGWKSEGKDRVVILEDRDGDGHFDSRKVFLDNGVNLTSVAIGFGGVWLLSVPNLIFLPDADGDGRPDGPPQILLDGWNIKEAGHNAVNNLTWGPDGWLYGLNGIQSKSLVGKPGAPEAERVKLDCGVWRYHPTRREFEVVAHGTTNPWGLDFDDYGQAFMTNCVIGHLWHVIPGAHYERMYGQDVNPYSYALMPGCADHLHWVGSHWSGSRGNAPEQHASGGGHAHTGAMVYLGDNWPATYRNSIYTCNLHGNRINRDVLEQRGSGYVGRHAPDFMFVPDSWFRGISILLGPDGGVFVSDWSDTGECHNYKAVDRSNGRIYKIMYGAPTAAGAQGPEDLAKLDDDALVKRLGRPNAWHARHATRLLQERAHSGTLSAAARTSLKTMVSATKDRPVDQLRALWALHAVGDADDSLLANLLSSEDPNVCGWAIRLSLEDRQASPACLQTLARLAQDRARPSVRMALASGLQRLPTADRWEIVAGLLSHQEDADDKSLSLMLWYAFEPLVPADPARALSVAAAGENPLVRRFAARRAISNDQAAGLEAIVRRLGETPDVDRRLDLLGGAQEALGGQRRVAMPAAWREAQSKLATSSDERIRSAARRLAVLFGDHEAIEAERRKVLDKAAATDDRREAIDILAQLRDAALPPLLFAVLEHDDPSLAPAALRALAGDDNQAIPSRVLATYARYDAQGKSDAISTLASRVPWAEALLTAIEKGSVPRGDLQAYHIQQMLGLKNDKLMARVKEVWGSVRATAADKQALIKKYKNDLAPDVLAKADLSAGRAVFVRMCANCHTLYGAGGKIGPDLTGAQRANLDYVLSNVLDPSAQVAKEYQITLVQTSSGRTISGIVLREDDRSLTLQTATEKVVMPKDEIEERQQTKTSLMPDGLFSKLTDAEIHDLVAYLGSREQAALKGE